MMMKSLIYTGVATIGLSTLLGLIALALAAWGVVYLLARLVIG